MGFREDLKAFLWHYTLFHVPYKRLTFIRTYLDFVTQLTLYQDPKLRRWALLGYPIVIVYSLKNLYLWYRKPSSIDCILHVDLAMVAFQTPLLYPCICAFACQTLYLWSALILNMRAPFIALLEDMFFRKRSSLLEGLTYGAFPARQATWRMLQTVLTTFQWTILFFDTVYGFVLLQIFTATFLNAGDLFGSPLEAPLTFLWNLLFMCTCFTVTVLGVVGFAYTMHTGGFLSLAFLLIINWRLKHGETLLAVYRKEPRPSFHLGPFKQYLAYSKVTFGSLFTGNATLGAIVTIFFAVNLPISAFLLMKLALEQQSLAPTISIALLAAYQVPGCFTIHLILAKLSKRLHAPSKVLLRLNAATAHRMGDFRARLRLNTAIIRLHSKVKYGFTYGPIGGRITMGSFSKCALLYVELLMYAYTFTRNI